MWSLDLMMKKTLADCRRGTIRVEVFLAFADLTRSVENRCEERFVLAQSGVSPSKSPGKESSRDFGHRFQFHLDDRDRTVVVKFGKEVSADVIGTYANGLRLHGSFEPHFPRS
jgi:hypothetical protein